MVLTTIHQAINLNGPKCQKYFPRHADFLLNTYCALKIVLKVIFSKYLTVNSNGLKCQKYFPGHALKIVLKVIFSKVTMYWVNWLDVITINKGKKYNKNLTV